MLDGLAYLVVGQDFEGEYNPGTNTGFTQTYIDEIQGFQINYNGQVPNSLSISNYQAQNDQVNFRRRDYNLGNVVLPNGQPALEIYGGVFTPGPGSLAHAEAGYRNPILIQGIGDTQVLPVPANLQPVQFAAHQPVRREHGVDGHDLPRRDQPLRRQLRDGAMRLPLFNVAPLPGRFAFRQRRDHARSAGERDHARIRDGEPVARPVRLGGQSSSPPPGCPSPPTACSTSTVARPADHARLHVRRDRFDLGLTTNQATQTMATNALFKIVLVPNVGRPTTTTLVDSLYQVLLGRSPSPAEQASWVTALNAGVPASHVAMDVIKSPEHRTLELDLLLQRVSERAHSTPPPSSSI